MTSSPIPRYHLWMLREAAIDPRNEPRQEPRQEILRTAARLFQQQGYDATSMNDVAAALKLSKGGLYHHFQSKRAFYLIVAKGEGNWYLVLF